MTNTILITDVVHEAGLAFLRERGYRLKFLPAKDEDAIIHALKDCDGMMVRGTQITKNILENAENLKIVVKHGVGADNIDCNAARKLGMMVCNTPLANAVSVAEQTMLLLLCCAKRLNMAQKAAFACDYGFRTRCFTDELEGKTLGLLGCGNIGSRVAQMAGNGFGMNVLVYDPFLTLDKVPSCAKLVAERETLFRISDYVSVHLPTLPALHLSIGTQEFGWMKPSAFFINISRGFFVDEAALIDALKNSRIAGAGLDVTTAEPIENDNLLLTMSDKVILTPHNAASSEAAMERMCMHAAQNLDDYFSGRRPQWVLE